jgi:hypothetical protein
MILMFFLISLAKCKSSTGVDSVNIYISRLGWNSFGITGTYVPRIAFYDDARRLVKINDKTKVKKLIENIREEQKTVVIHLILSQIIEPSRGDLGEHLNYENNSAVKSVDYLFNGLTWTDNSKENRTSISLNEIDKIEKYWRKKCHL